MDERRRVLYLDPDPASREAVRSVLDGDGDRVVVTETDPTAALETVSTGRFDCVIGAYRLAGDGGSTETDGVAFLREVGERDPQASRLLLVEDGSEAVASEAVAAGLSDYLQKPDPSDAAALEALRSRAADAVEGARTRRDATAAERRMDRLVEATTDVITVVGEDMTVEYVSGSVESVLGLSPADVVGGSALAYVHPDDRAEVAEKFEAILAADDWEPGVEFRGLGGDGSVRFLEARARDLREDPAVGGIVTYTRDVTERKRRERRVEAMLGNSSDVTTLVGEDGEIRYESRSTRRVKGYEPDELVGEDVVDRVHPDDRDRVATVFDPVAMVPGTVAGPVTYRFRGPDGDYRWVESTATDPAPDSPLDGLVVNTRDVSGRVERERQLQVLDRVLRHNLNNDLDVAMGYAEQVRNRTDDPEVAAYAGRILDQCRGLLETIDKEREIVELLVEEPDPVRVDLAGLVEGAVGTVTERHPDADVEVSTPATATCRVVPGFGRAIEELVDNAVRHADGGEGADAGDPATVTVELVPGEDAVILRVSDEGPGIPEAEIGVLVDAVELDQLTHASGMGLWLVHWYVQRSGGDVAFESCDDAGSVVTVTLPVADGE